MRLLQICVSPFCLQQLQAQLNMCFSGSWCLLSQSFIRTSLFSSIYCSLADWSFLNSFLQMLSVSPTQRPIWCLWRTRAGCHVSSLFLNTTSDEILVCSCPQLENRCPILPVRNCHSQWLWGVILLHSAVRNVLSAWPFHWDLSGLRNSRLSVFELSTHILRIIIRDDNIRNAMPWKHSSQPWQWCLKCLLTLLELWERSTDRKNRSLPTFSHELSTVGCESNVSLGLLSQFDECHARYHFAVVWRMALVFLCTTHFPSGTHGFC